MTAEAPVLRDAVEGDLAGIAALDALRAGSRKPAYWQHILRRFARGGAEAGRVALVAADAGGRVQGFVFGEVRAWEFGSDRCGWIFSVAVNPDRERRGLGTRLCEEAVRRFAALGVDVVRTMVRRNDVPMLALFRSMGFRAGPFSEMERRVPMAVRREEGVA